MGVPSAKLLAGPEPLNINQMIVVHEYFAPGVPHSCETTQHLKAVASGLYTLKRKLVGAPNHGLGALAPCDTVGMPEALAVAASRWAHTSGAANDYAIMHADFKARNLRFDGLRISAIYDFESLRVCSESYLVGYSSVAFTGGHERLNVNFDIATARAFVAAYEQARGQRFSAVQTKAAYGGMIHSLIRMGRLVVMGGSLTADGLADRVMAFEAAMTSRHP